MEMQQSSRRSAATMAIDYAGTDAVIPPGEILQEELDARGMTQRELAQKMRRPIQSVNEIIKGKRALTSETALDLERVLGIEAAVWVRLEGEYRLARARGKLSHVS
jgi:HTH-type transcriptional regulator/antitoxin HigA